MRHVGQELRLGPVGQLGSLSSLCVSLDTVPEVEHHLVDLPLQLVHLSGCFDFHYLGKVPVGGSISDVSKGSHLGRLEQFVST